MDQRFDSFDKGISLSKIRAFLKLLEEKKVHKEQFQALLETGLFADVISANPYGIDREELKKVLGIIPKSFLLDPELSGDTYGSAFSKANFDKWDDMEALTKTYPFGTEISMLKNRARLLSITSPCLHYQVAGVMKDQGCTFAKMQHFLQFAGQFPEEQKKYPIFLLEEESPGHRQDGIWQIKYHPESGRTFSKSQKSSIFPVNWKDRFLVLEK